MRQRKGVLMDVEGEGGGEQQICSFMWADNFWNMKYLEQMLKDLIEEAAKVDLAPMLSCLRWTGTYASEQKEGRRIQDAGGRKTAVGKQSLLERYQDLQK